MDINAIYQKILGKSALILVAQDYGDDVDPEDMVELAQAVSDLDDWIRKGGFLPDAWKRPDPIIWNAEAPAHWADYFAGDEHQLSEAEIKTADAWLVETGGTINHCSAITFPGEFDGQPCELREYTLVEVLPCKRS